MEIEHLNSFKQALANGVNLFVGAGFSVLAKDGHGRKLPLGGALKRELEDHFGKKGKNLPMLSTILKRTKLDEFNAYLTERFTVKSFDDKYLSINLAALKYIFTTNIDNLIPQIVGHRDSRRYISDLRENGECTDVNAVQYLPLHGNIDKPGDNFIFSISEIASIFSNAPRLWGYLSHAVEKYPTVFLGYGFDDASTIQSVTSDRYSKLEAQKEKWIVLYEDDEESREYFHSLNFNIIVGSTEEFLEELPALLEGVKPDDGRMGSRHVRELFAKNVVPANGTGLTTRGILHYFKGMEPTWGDILSTNIVKTSHFDDIMNSVRGIDKHTLIIGTPLCGKSTLAMQVAAEVSGYKLKLYFDDMTLTKAEYLLKYLTDNPTLIVVENFADDIEGFNKLATGRNIKLIGVARSFDFGMISHRLDSARYNIFNVTEVSDADFQKVYMSLPSSARKSKLKISKANHNYKRDTIFEFVLKNIKGQSIEDRYKEVLERCEEGHARMLALCAYMHYCRVPLSMEVVFSFFEDTYPYTYSYQLKKELDDLLKELDDNELDNLDEVDYYFPRSTHLANVILKYSSDDILQEVLRGVVERVPRFVIPRYYVFKRYALDHRLVGRVFKDWKLGCKLYDDAFVYDLENPYVLQQQALYLSSKKQFKLAFDKIDKAKTMTNDANFAIRNSHAIILFESNIDATDHDVELQLDESMEILRKCYANDKRKTYHAVVFSEQAKRYFKKSPGEKTKGYLDIANQWLSEEIKTSPWSYECRNLHREVLDILDKI